MIKLVTVVLHLRKRKAQRQRRMLRRVIAHLILDQVQKVEVHPIVAQIKIVILPHFQR
jgi:hypothetical protein